VPARRELAELFDRMGRSDAAAEQRAEADRLETQERMRRSKRELMKNARS